MDTAGLVPIESTLFRSMNPTADSLRLLSVGYDYLGRLEIPHVLGICVFSSVAWGNATPVSDVDIGFVVPDGTAIESGKHEFEGVFIDHCEWPWNWIENAIKDPLSNHILSYSLANRIVLFDADDRLAEARRRLECAVMRPPGGREWVEFYLDLAGRMRDAAWKAHREDRAADLSGFLFTGVRRYADAVLHFHPGGHCGEWPSRLREYATAAGERRLYSDAAAVITPEATDVQELAAAIDPLERLHLASAGEPRGTSLGCSGTSGRYFARKARYFARLGDFLSLLHVLRKQTGYVRENISAKGEAPPGGINATGSDLGRVEGMIKSAWPAMTNRNPVRLQTFDDFASRVMSFCRSAPGGNAGQ